MRRPNPSPESIDPLCTPKSVSSTDEFFSEGPGGIRELGRGRNYPEVAAPAVSGEVEHTPGTNATLAKLGVSQKKILGM